MKGADDSMDEQQIIDMYFSRDEHAISATQAKYGRYLQAIAMNILSSRPDAEECENDTYLRAWGSIPPHRPNVLRTFLGKITRRLALDRYDYLHAEKRLTGATLALEELGDCIPAGNGDPSDTMAFRAAFNRFLAALPKRERVVFMRRYWFLSPVREIARDMGLGESHIKIMLHRTRAALKAHLEKEGIVL